MHEVQADLLRRLAEVCRAHNLRYFAVFGTLLGAVRHGGFIPWDDDVDIAMPRKDYDRLLALGREVFTGDYCLQYPEMDSTSFYGGYAKLRNTAKGARPYDIRLRTGIPGVWIDIFPVDYVSEKEEERRKQEEAIRRLQLMKYCRSYRFNRFPLDGFDNRKLFGLYLKSKLMNGRRWMKLLNRAFTRVKGSRMVGILACYYGDRPNRNYFPEEWVEDVEMMPFEDFEIPVPKGYHGMLLARYGEDYRKLPPPSSRTGHSRVEFDLRRNAWEMNQNE